MQSRRDLSGQVVNGRYRVVAPIGKGAMGSVYRGEHVGLGRLVAVKFINEDVPGEMVARQRFEREAKAMAKLEHPHCASVLDVGIHNERPFVVMELVDGQNLKELVDRGPLPIERAVDITRQVLSGLAHAHEHGIIHRDIKPANIVLSQKAGLGDHVKILDFGLAKMNRDTSNLTSGVIVGTPSYMAPEQILGQLLDTRVDLYACGVLLFELLTGSKPFQSANNEPVEVCMQHLNQPPPRLHDVTPSREFGALEDVVAKALAKNRDERYATAAEFAAALAGAAGVRARAQSAPPEPTNVATVHLGPIATATRTPRRRIGVRWIVMASALLVLAVATVIVYVTHDTERSVEARASVPTVIDAMPVDAPVVRDAVDDLIAQSAELARAGRREAAIDLLVKARKTYPDDARLPYRAGLLYLDRMWWADGLKQLRAAIALDASYKTDPELIKAVIRGFNTTAQYDGTLASFLRKDIGPAAKPYLEDTASSHPNALVRKRASNELRRY